MKDGQVDWEMQEPESYSTTKQIEHKVRSDFRRNVARVTESHGKLIASSIEWLRSRIAQPSIQHMLLSSAVRQSYLDSQLANMDRILAYITNFYLPLVELRRGVVEICRAWLYSVAWLDYMDVFHKLIGTNPYMFPHARHVMGSCTYDPLVVTSLAAAGIPVWLIQPITTFKNQNVWRVVTARPIPQDINHALEVETSRIIYRGANGTVKHHAAISGFSSTLR